MKTVKSTLIIALFCTILHSPLYAQVTIGSKETPVKGAILDLKQTKDLSTKGLLLPRVALEKIDQLYPMFGTENNVNSDYQTDKTNIDLAHAGLTIYNMTTDLEEGLCPGVYVWLVDVWKRLPPHVNLLYQLKIRQTHFS